MENQNALSWQSSCNKFGNKKCEMFKSLTSKENLDDNNKSIITFKL